MVEVKDPLWLWQFRFVCLSFGGLRIPQQKCMVTWLPLIVISFKTYEDSVVSKQLHSQFLKEKPWRTESVLRLVHTDICGPIKAFLIKVNNIYDFY